MSDMTIAKTIMAQMGGGKFTAMTGAKNFIGSENGLSFRFPNRRGPNACRIVLTSMDLYDVEFIRIRKKGGIPEHKTVSKHDGVYADQLQSIFTGATGLNTHL